MSGIKLSVSPMVWILCLLLVFSSFPPAYAYAPTTLSNGTKGEEVKQLQQALITLNYLSGTPDGIFGNKTENAVRNFQRKNGLDVDGLAGKNTKEKIFRAADLKKSSESKSAKDPDASGNAEQNSGVSSNVASGDLFAGNYSTIRIGNRGKRVTLLQKALISVGILTGKADGIFGKKTLDAVIRFQKNNHLSADGLAGKQTLKSLEKLCSTPAKAKESTNDSGHSEDTADSGINARISAPDKSSLKLLHWYNDVKPSLSNGRKLLLYDPSSGLSWTLRVLACGRHCDAEPLTAKDTHTMILAFGGKKTWSQKAVWVKLPDGRWTIGSTHDMPHLSGNIKDNDFDGHLCVHFLRDMDETLKNDPSYGVSNQKTIRSYWEKISGQEISY